MFCPNCGNEVAQGTTFCGKCGKQIGEAKPAVKAEPAVAVLPKTVKKAEPIITRELITKIGFCALLTAFYVGIAVLLIMLLGMNETIKIKTAFDNDVFGILNLDEFLKLLMQGNRAFNPTTVSTALAIGTYIFVYAVPFMGIAALISTAISKKTFSLQIGFTLIASIAAALCFMVPLLAVKLVPQFKNALCVNAGIILGDFKTVTVNKLLIFAVIIFVLIIGALITTIIFNKRRAK